MSKICLAVLSNSHPWRGLQPAGPRFVSAFRAAALTVFLKGFAPRSAACAVLVCGFAVLAVPSAQAGNSSGLTAGKKTFQESCSMCHGADASGGMGPSLRGKLKHGSDRAAIQSVIKNGVPGTAMPAMKTMPAATLGHLTDYILSLQKSGK